MKNEMKVQIEKVHLDRKETLMNLMQLYIHDLSEYIDLDVDDQGRFDYRYFDLYWQEENRHPFFIKTGDQLAGFGLVNQQLKFLKDPAGHAMAEFFILRNYRRSGIGSMAAKEIFGLFKGKWEVSQLISNPAAQEFWQSVIQEYTDGNFSTHLVEVKGLDRRIIIFDK